MTERNGTQSTPNSDAATGVLPDVRRLAHECGAVSYTPGVMRAVRGVSLTFEQLDEFAARLRAAANAPVGVTLDDGPHHGLDTAERVCFYEQDFYVLSNFSSFSVRWAEHSFPTSEHAYHWEKFRHAVDDEGVNDRFQRISLAENLMYAPSAHAAFKLAEQWKRLRRPDWDSVKVSIMRDILRAKASQHEYVRRKLLETGDRELVENSWRDDFWGWGPNRDGANMLGKLWMEVRSELRLQPGR